MASLRLTAEAYPRAKRGQLVEWTIPSYFGKTNWNSDDRMVFF
jgi:hypothetical protein